jgi:murein DD-endopeptidase MepM/ murein hydrolase activator NlpD
MLRHRSFILAALLIAAIVAIDSVVTAQADGEIDIAVEARSLQPGELVVLTITFRTDPTSVRVTAFGRRVPAFRLRERVWRALAGIDLEQAAGPATVEVETQAATGAVRASRALIVLPKRFEVRTLEVPPEFVNPPPSVQHRIEAENAFLKTVYSASAPQPLWRGPFVRPVPGEANSRFGTRSRFNGELRSPHAGTDFLSGLGTPIKAPNAGKVVAARDLYFSGNTVIIDHGQQVYSMLAHLSRIDVQENETVEAGHIVGLVGATGRVTGPHLHWALRVSGARVDPLSALALLGTDAAKRPEER